MQTATPLRKANGSGAQPPELPVELQHDEAAERALIASMIMEPSHIAPVFEITDPEHFCSTPHRWIVRSIKAVWQSGKAVDVVTVAGYLREIGKLGEVGRAEYLATLVDEVPAFSLDNSIAHAEIVFRKWQFRAVKSEALALAAKAQTGSVEDIGAAARDTLAHIEGIVSKPSEAPTADDPLGGLKYLNKVAVMGRARFVALASEPIDYVWQDLVVASTICLIAGPPAEGKTSLLFLILAARLNTGKPLGLLGHEIQPAPEGQLVVLIEGEHGESSASRKIVKSLDLLGVDDSALDRLVLIARKSVKLGSPEWDDVVKLISAGLVSDIALDTIARVAPANPDSEQEQVAIFETVAAAIDSAPEDRKPTAWAIAHTRKNGGGTLADVAGSAQRTGQADSVLMLKADKSSGRVASVEVTFEKLREAPEEYPGPAMFVIGKGTDGQPALIQDAAPTTEADDRPLEARILDLLAIEPRTASALTTSLNRSWASVDAALTALFTERRIQTTTVKVRGNGRKAFALRDVTQ